MFKAEEPSLLYNLSESVIYFLGRACLWYSRVTPDCLEIILFRDHLEVLEELVSWGACKAGYPIHCTIVLSCCALLPMAISQKYCIMQLILFPSFRCISVVMFKGYHLLLCQGFAGFWLQFSLGSGVGFQEL